MFEIDNIKLRPILRSDLTILNKWKNDEEIYKYLGGGFNPVSIDQQENWIDKLINIDNYNKRYIIEYDGVSVGMIGLYSINNIYQNCEIGIYIGEKNYHGKGIAAKSMLLLEDYARKYLNIRKIKCYVVLENKKAHELWKRIGFKDVGVLKEERFIDGKFMDVMIMEKFLNEEK